MSNNVIRDTERLNQRQLDTVKRRNDRDIKRLEENHQNYKADVKKTQDLEIVDIQNTHQNQVSKEAEKKEKVLAEMRNHLEQTRSFTDKELKELKDYSKRENESHAQKNSVDRDRINGEHELFLEDLNDRYNTQVKKISHEGSRRIEQTKDLMGEKQVDQEKFHQQKLNDQTTDFTSRFNTDSKNYRMMKDNQDHGFKKERLASNLRQQTELKKMSDQHTTNFEARDNHYRKGMKEQDLFFEEKYEKQLGRHNEDFKTLEQKNKRVVENLKTSLTKEISTYAEKNDDPFFQFTAMKPHLRQYDDRVEIEVEVPEHSKQDVQLTIHGKEAIIGFNRRYNDANKLEDGTINKVNKVESFTTRLPTQHVLNAKSVKSSYEDGVMTYTIMKT